jgi:hypothetical protein
MLQYAGGILQVFGGLGVGLETGKAGMKAMRESVRAGVFARFQARRKAMDIREEGGEFVARQQTLWAKSGVVLDSGSPLLTKIDTLRKIERDAIRTEQYGDEAYRQKKHESEMLFKQAQLQAVGAFLGSASTAITSYGKYSQSYKAPKEK